MIHYFKNKNKIQADAFTKGYEKGYRNATYAYKKQHNIIVNRFKKIIEKKDKRISSMKKSVERLNNSLEAFSIFFAKAGHVTSIAEEKATQEMRAFIEEYQSIRKICDEFQHLKRNYQSKYPKIDKKIKKFQKENIE